MNKLTVSALHIYPLKSAQGIKITEMPIEAAGPKWDREWMLINETTKSFISQRTHPQMSQISTQLSDNSLQVGFAGFEPLNIPLENLENEKISVRLFGKETLALSVGKTFDEWFSDVLNQKVKLVRSPKEQSRETSGNHGPKTEIKFPDGYPFLLTNNATLEELNKRLGTNINMQRFRPNIIIEGAPANEEDTWGNFQIANVNFQAVKACTRCSVIDVDPETGQSSKEVSAELKKYRTKDNQIIFGMNLSHLGTGTIRLGDTILSS